MANGYILITLYSFVFFGYL